VALEAKGRNGEKRSGKERHENDQSQGEKFSGRTLGNKKKKPNTVTASRETRLKERH